MSSFLQLLLIMTSVCFLSFVLYMVRRERFLLKYSFLWLVLGLIGIVAAIAPGWVYLLSEVLGFEEPVNLVLFLCVVFLMAISLVFCAVVSRQTRRITRLVQEMSILKSKISQDTGFSNAIEKKDSDFSDSESCNDTALDSRRGCKSAE